MLPSDTTPTASRKRAPKQTPRKEIFGDVLRDKTIIDTIYKSESQPSCLFAVAEPGHAPKLVESYAIRGETVFPLQRQAESYRRGIVTLPSDIGPSIPTSELLASLRRLLAKYIDLDPFYISLIAHYVLMTWVWSAFGSYGFLRLKGTAGCGKTRVLDVLKRLVYRGTHIGVNPSKSALFRMADKVMGTLLIDECDRQDADLYSGFCQMLNASYRRDGVVTLSEKQDESWVPTTYNVGGPKILSTRLTFGDQALETRCLTIPMAVKEIARHIAPHLPQGFEEEAEAMRNKLLSWRFANLHGIQLDDSALRHLEPRAREIGLSLYAISPDEEFRTELIRYLERRGEDFAGEDPSRVVLEVIADMMDKGAQWKLTVKAIRASALSIALERDISPAEFSSRQVAELSRNLRFNTSREGKGVVVKINSAILREQRERYKL